MREEACRSCGSGDLCSVLSLGETPLADRLVSERGLAEPDPTAPLELAICERCALVQITETVPPEILFGGDYPYFSSVSPTLLEHSRTNALDLIDRLGLDSSSFVVEIASNDGYLLKNFLEHGIPVLGIDPAKDPAAEANRIGVETLNDFFGRDLARRVREERGQADLILANNVLAHVADLNGLVAGIATLLKGGGQAVLEMPYVVDLVRHVEFDTIYHQHLCYFSVTALDHLFRRHGLVVQGLRRLAIHGGSLRIFVGHEDRQSETVRRYLDTERAEAFDGHQAYGAFAERVRHVTARVREILDEHKRRGARLVAYGAAAKGTTMLATCGIGRETLDYVVDRNHYKHGRYMPGSRLPILPTERLLEDRPDAALLLTWNFADEIFRQQAAYLEAGGVFIVPIPEPRVVTRETLAAERTPVGAGV